MATKVQAPPQKLLPIFILTNFVVFPGTTRHIRITNVGWKKFFDDQETAGVKTIACVYHTEFGGQALDTGHLHQIATECLITKIERDDDAYLVSLYGKRRLLSISWTEYQTAYFVDLEDFMRPNDPELTERTRAFEQQVNTVLPMMEDGKSGAKRFNGLPSISAKMDFLLSLCALPNADDYKKSVAYLAAPDMNVRLKIALKFLLLARDRAKIKNQITAATERELAKSNRKYILHEQKEALQKELEECERANDAARGLAPAPSFEEQVAKRIKELEAALAEKKISAESPAAEAIKVIKEEFKRLAVMQPSSSEAGKSRDYLDVLVHLPWLEKSEDNKDTARARAILEADHYGMKKPKKRILEYVALHTLVPDRKGPILCFVGPPGVGKTSIGKSLARALGRKFIRKSLGGVRDETVIRGHRRTYVGSLPGCIIQGLIKAGTQNPVFMLDEIDKLSSDNRGDPSAALLEALDREHNCSFSDHYVGTPFDLSNVIFICTANNAETIPPALYDRLEVIELPGYTPDEKYQIAVGFLIPKELEEHGFKPAAIKFEKEIILQIIERYTRESGVRNLERELANVIRQIAVRKVEELPWRETVSSEDVRTYLGPEQYEIELIGKEDEIGVATGLFWTPAGGGVLTIEAVLMPGQGILQVTGNLQDPPKEYTGDRQLVNTMRESIQYALSYVKSHLASELPPDFFAKRDIHVHCPKGATPKDGPSAGLAIATALASLVTGKRVRHDLAMTGETDLLGRALPIGGLKAKLLGAHRAGAKQVLIPLANYNRDLDDIPDEIQRELKITPVTNITEVLSIALIANEPHP
ncbi:MAG: endopeptidase La [Candidatus Margulisiibacteriota bacterium]